MKRDLKASAQAFQAEGKVSSDPVGEIMILSICRRGCTFQFVFSGFYYFGLLIVFLSAIDAPGGFLFEWWSVFWDIFIARTNEKHSEVAASYIEVVYFINWTLS